MGLTEEEQIWVEEQFHELIKISHRLRSQEDIDLVRKAFDLANEAHSKMRRKSGEPYITHPIAVAKIIASEIGLGVKSIVSALLHDVVEDTDYTLNDIETLFGPSISGMIDGLTKISNILDKESSLQVENFRKMILTMSQDVRVIFIKLADRLHNMRTLDSMPEYKQVKIASETTFLYAPLAHRLGLYSIKTELEDLALKHEHPLIYREISKKFKETEEERNKYIEEIKNPLKKILDENGIKCNIIGRTKSIFSIWNKMQTKNVTFEEIYDLFAIRIIFDHPDNYPESKARAQCYNIMSLVTEVFPHMEQRVRDWVAKPKANGYEALHVTVMGPRGDWVEVQIRSRKMDDIAEKGLASHWKYKINDKDSPGSLDLLINTLNQTLKNNTKDSLSFLDDVKMSIFTKEIYVFTPKGEIKNIPKGSTVIDYAYEIHTEVGNKAIAAKVNHQLKPLTHVLNSGDQVEVLTSEKQYPKREWLNFAITSKAKEKIKNSFKEERIYFINKGQELFISTVRALNIKLDHKLFKELRKSYDSPNKEEFYYKVGAGLIQIDDIEKRVVRKNSFLASYWKPTISKFTTKQNKNDKNTLLIEDFDNKKITFATCCNPIPGDEVAGYINPSNSIIIHRKVCDKLTNLAATQGDKIIAVKWSVYKLLSFITKIRIEGVDKLGMLHKITRVISQDSNVNMKNLSFNTEYGIFTGEITLYVHDTQDLDDLMKDLLRIDGINKVIRLEDQQHE